MFSIETTDDIKILKELTGISNDPRIVELENKVAELSKSNLELAEITTKQMKIINELKGKLVTADDCRGIVTDLMNKKSTTTKTPAKRGRVKVVQSSTDEFNLIPTMKKKFNRIIVEGNTLIHYTIKNQKMKLPISTLELMAMVEIYQHRQRKLLNQDATNICKLYDISKIQFGKLYYNLQEGVFFNALEEIDKQIRRTNFKVVNESIHIVEGGRSIDTGIDNETFNRLSSIYVNSNQPYSTIYKLSREYKNIDPVHLLTVLRRNSIVSKTI